MCIVKKGAAALATDSKIEPNDEASYYSYEKRYSQETKPPIHELTSKIVTKENAKFPYWYPDKSQCHQLAQDWLQMAKATTHESRLAELLRLDSEKHQKTFVASTVNSHKNRETWDNQHPCQDEGRIVLKFPGLTSDYIHANYVGTTKENTKRFICTQSPSPDTARAFWAMVIQENVEKIVVMDKQPEDYFHRYWPSLSPDDMRIYGRKNEMGSISIVCKGKTTHYRETLILEKLAEEVGITEMQFNVTWTTPEGKKVARYVTIFKIKNWDDKYLDSQIVDLVLAVWNTKTPVVVHCPSGVGLTGTFVAVAAIHETMFKDMKVPSVIDIVRHLRVQRHQMVYWSSHYELIYQAVNYFMKGKCGHKLEEPKKEPQKAKK